jgi:hypothetical protein
MAFDADDTGQSRGGEAVSKLDEMWAALEAHKPAPEYAEAWMRMLKERTPAAAFIAHWTAPAGSAAASAALTAHKAANAAADVERVAAKADIYAQHAIDAIKEVKP